MARWYHLITLVLLMVALATPATHHPVEAQSGSDIISLVNAFRAANGMSALAVDGSLMAAAQGHANWMAAAHTMSHSGEGGSTPGSRAQAAGYTGLVLENIAYGTIGFVSTNWAVNDMWANSYIHRVTMLSDAAYIGAGVASDGVNDYYVLEVGKAPPPPPSQNTNTSNNKNTTNNNDDDDEEEVDPGPVVIPIIIAEPDENGAIYHVVQEGQTAWAIAARYDVPLEDLVYLNSWQLPVVLQPGDRVLVKLGPGQAPPPTPTPVQQVPIQEGQTIWEIAVTHNLTVDQLLEYNGMQRGTPVYPGTMLWLMPPAPTSEVPPTESAPVSTEAPPVSTEVAPPTTEGTPEITPTPSPTPYEGVPPTATYLPTLTPGAVAVAVVNTPDVILIVPTDTPTTTSKDSGPDQMTVIGIAAFALVWGVVIGVGLMGWLHQRRSA
jgi:uncharacterized protein YkwD/LysM repeat protein